MTEQSLKPTGRSQALYRFIITVLLVGIIVALTQLAFTVLAYESERNAIAAQAPAIAATGTALASELEPEATPESETMAIRAKRIASGYSQAFPTNTPNPANTPVPVVEATPTIEAPVTAETPRPLPTLFIYSGPDAASAAPTAIPSAVPALDRHGNDLINIVLLGDDSEITGETVARTDSMVIVSINRTSGTVAMLSIPRDMYVFIPSWTMQRVNAAFPYGEAVGWTDGGFGLLRQTLFYNFGINVHYYAMVNLSGFKTLIDAVGGIDLAVDCAIQDLPLMESEVPAGAYPVGEDGEYALPVGYYHMSGAEALWYARSRNSSSDFDRGSRQQQLLRAIWRTARENGLISQAPTLISEGLANVHTNMTLEDLLSLVPLAAEIDASRIETFDLVRTYHTTPWQTPDGDYVQLPVYETLRPLLEDFYTPPTQNQISVEAASIAVYNGTTNLNLDRVAAEALQNAGFNAAAMGQRDVTDAAATTLIDFTGATKGSSLEAIAGLLNVSADGIDIQPMAQRDFEFEVTLGANYNSCRRQGVLPVDPPEAGA
ncbi:MAG: LCP family protein [Anaerolineae bacterium]|nr:LCP family protein [Anaerolineae bacterium]